MVKSTKTKAKKPKRNYLVAQVMRKAVRKHKNKKRAVSIDKPNEKEYNYD
jgi:hypothetical protein